MKRTFLLFLMLCCGIPAAFAQDLIVKTDASRIEARVTEISPETIRYKRFSNPDGPTYLLPVADVERIEYANGETEYFNRPAPAPVSAAPDAPAAPAVETPAVPASPAAPTAAVETPAGQTGAYPVQYELKRYKVGDLYDGNGVKGVVFKVSDDGLHGLLVSLDEAMLPWSLFRKGDLCTVGASDSADGRANMEAVARYIAEKGLSWDDFPAFKWCREQGEGWYLPSIDELLVLGNSFNGGTRVHYDRQARNRFNDALKEHGGKRMDRLVYYFSSTELNEKEAHTTHMDMKPPYVVEIPKYNKFLVRAVHAF